MTFRTYSWYVRGAHHANLARTSIESVKKADRFSKCIVVTDDDVHIDGVVTLKIEAGLPIMLANLEAQVAVRNYVKDEAVYFLDTDTLLLKPFEIPVCDIAFTWRDSIGLDDDGEKVEGIAARMPYNYGVMVVAPTLGGIESLIWLRERVRVMHDSSKKWYGNQLAAAELAGARPESGTAVSSKRIPWRMTQFGREVFIGKLPCSEYNWTPQALGESLEGKYVAHFKGGKRALMEPYAKSLGLGWYVA
jgi:hypothetical protein